MFTKKEKPTYSVWQNSAYIIGRAWRLDKIVILTILAQIVVTVAISTVAIFLPAVVVEQILAEVTWQTLVTTVLLFTLATAALQAANNYLTGIERPKRIGMRLKVMLDIIEKVVTTDYANLGEKDFTDKRQKAINQVNSNDNTTEQIYFCYKDLGINLLGFVVYMLLLIAVNPIILVITAVTSVLAALARQWANKWQHDNDAERTEPDKRINYINNIAEKHSLAKDIRLFAMTDWIKDVYDASMNLAFAFSKRVQARHLIADAVDCAAIFVREGIAYAYLIWMVLTGVITVDVFVLLFAAVGGFSAWITGILNEFSALSMHSLNICRVREFLDFSNKFRRSGGIAIPAAKADTYSLELRNVSFKYSGAEKNTLENINLTVKPGEKLAVVGLNGAGKTTLVKLLCGLFDPTEGAVLLDGVDIREFNRDEYYKLFTAVFQEFNILPYSIAGNIAQDFGEDADDARVRECIEMAGLSGKIANLPDGTDSLMVREVHLDGVEFSGGETQRLMLARALYKNAPILILDEPTAALDPIAESELYERYNELSYGRSSVYISHRLASTRFCDRIILVDNKGIAEMGTHDELIEAGGKYAELYDIQSKYYQEGEVAS